MSDTNFDLPLCEDEALSSPSFEERLSEATRDYEMLNGEHLADLGI